MPRLRSLAPRLSGMAARLRPPAPVAEQRITGRRLQERRLRVWSKDPHCADCRALTSFPDGFELDHDVALVNGGEDTDENCRVRCQRCHEAKTKRDLEQAGLASAPFRRPTRRT